jgi:hypothetical protein
MNESSHAMAFTSEAAAHLPASASEFSSNGTIIVDRQSYAADPIEALPANSQAKLRTLRQSLEDFRLLAREASDKWNDALKRKGEAQTAYDVLTDHDAASRWGGAIVYKPADIDYVAANPSAHEGESPHESTRLSPLRTAVANLARAKTELALATDLRDARSFRKNQIGPIVRSIETYLGSTRGNRLTEHAAVTLDLKKTETVTSAIERARKDIARLNADLHTIRSAPIPSSVVKARARAEINGLAQQGRPNVFDAIEAGERIQWPDETIRATTILHALLPGDGFVHTAAVDGIVDTRMPSTMQVLAWLFKEKLTEAIEQEIDQCADDASALSDADRAKKLKATLDEILEIERHEEALIEMAATQGQEVGRRAECDPRAVLGVIGPAPRADY